MLFSGENVTTPATSARPPQFLLLYAYDSKGLLCNCLQVSWVGRGERVEGSPMKVP